MSEPYLGEIRYFAFNFAPVDWLVCDGSTISIAENEALFALIGTTYGGDGVNNFALPDLRGRVPVGVGPVNPLGAAIGSETATLSTNQLPSHGHALVASTAAATATAPGGEMFAANAQNAIYAAPAAPTAVAMSAAMIGASGLGQPHENRAPTLTLQACIATNGDYPSQS